MEIDELEEQIHQIVVQKKAASKEKKKNATKATKNDEIVDPVDKSTIDDGSSSDSIVNNDNLSAEVANASASEHVQSHVIGSNNGSDSKEIAIIRSIEIEAGQIPYRNIVLTIFFAVMIAFILKRPRGTFRRLWKRIRRKVKRRLLSRSSSFLSYQPEDEADSEHSNSIVRTVLSDPSLNAPNSRRGLHRRGSAPDSPLKINGPLSLQHPLLRDYDTDDVIDDYYDDLDDMSEENRLTEEERFERIYKTLRKSSFGRLVLPPQCKLIVDKRILKETKAVKERYEKFLYSSTKDKVNEEQKKKQRHEADININEDDTENEEDNPLHRLKLYLSNFLMLVHTVYIFNYNSAMQTILHWIQSWTRYNKEVAFRKQNTIHGEEGEEEESRINSEDEELEKDGGDADDSILQSGSQKHRPVKQQQLPTPQRLFQSFVSTEEDYSDAATDETDAATPIQRNTSLLDSNDHKYKDGEQKQQNILKYKAYAGSETSSTTEASSSNGTLEFDPSLVGPKLIQEDGEKQPEGGMCDGEINNLVAKNKQQMTRAVGEATLSPATTTYSSRFLSLPTPAVEIDSSGDILLNPNNNERKGTTKRLSPILDIRTATEEQPNTPRETATIPELTRPADHDKRKERGTSTDDLAYFDTATSRQSLVELSKEVALPDKNGYIVSDSFLTSKDTPLLVFVNSRSGPQQGHVLKMQLRRLLNPIQVWDLCSDGSPDDILESFSVLSKLRILVCGGDGTVGWIISAIEKVFARNDHKSKLFSSAERWPPIAILPLGTGNDLARIHGWGGGYSNESLIMILEQISGAYISLLDRWEMSSITNISKTKGANDNSRVKDVKLFTNYLGVGVDAQAALQVHMLRESTPDLFFSRAVNKAWYALFGAEDAIKHTCANIPQEITLIADGVKVPLPPDSQGIILLNIDSYAGGIAMWADGVKSEFRGSRRYYHQMASDDDSSTGSTSSLDGRFTNRRTRSMGSLQSLNGVARSNSSSFERVDSMDDLFSEFYTEEERLARVTACKYPSSCQDGMLEVVSLRGTYHLGQVRVGLSNADLLCQCREAKIILKKKCPVQIDGEPWRQSPCTLHIRRKKDPAIMLHRSPDESGGVETEMAKLLDWAEERGHIDRGVHSTLMKEFSRRIESKARQRRYQSQDNLMFSLKQAIAKRRANTRGNLKS